jgi:homocysteine S-methyltransferase
MDTSFLQRLAAGPLLGDGALGTLVLAQGDALAHPLEALTRTDSARVLALHRAYLAAGAEVLTTNTFGANRLRLAPQGLDAEVQALNRQAVTLARTACEGADGPVFVAGAIGPLGVSPLDLKEWGAERVRAVFREQAAGLREGGVDLYLLETFGNAEELAWAVEGVRSICDRPLVAQLTVGADGRTLAGQTLAEAWAQLRPLAIPVLGTNCNLGPQATLAVIRTLVALGVPQPFAAFPSAGLPTRVETGWTYGVTPQALATYARPLVVVAGVGLLGGCCGTTPAHIRALRAALGPPGAA